MGRAVARTVGRPVVPTGIARDYSARIAALLIPIIREHAERAIAEYEKRNDASDWIRATRARMLAELERAAASKEIAKTIDLIGERVDKHATGQTAKLVAISLADVVPSSALKKFRTRNLNLIKRLARSQVADLRGILEHAERVGSRVEVVRREVKERFKVARSHADLIARDQVLKLNGQITKQRQKQAGITKYRWSTSKDERVRKPFHQDLEGKIFSWDDPPVTDRKGNRNHPGDDFQCRCVAIPVLN